MKFLRSLLPSLFLLSATAVEAASSWNFEEATVSVTSKGSAGGASKDKLSASSPLLKPVTLGAQDTLKIILTATEAGKAKRPHQAFLLLKEQDSGLETAFPLSLKETGKGKVDFAQKDLPVQLQSSSKPLRATLLLASFGSSKSFSSHVFDLDVKLDPSVSHPQYEKPLRYGKLAEINHIFKADPKSGPVVISLFFVLAILATLPVLFGTWAFLGANFDHLSKATAAAPISHGLLFGSIVSMEGIFFLYYYKWTLFRTLPFAGAIAVVAFVSWSKALSEVQSRRLAGER